MNGTRPAERLLQGFGISEPQQIDLEAIAYELGATVKYRPLHGCEARILGHGDVAVITVDSKTQPARQRFSVAHELGHWYCHRGRSLVCRSDDIGNPARSLFDPERIADGYAADLLLPQYLFKPRANGIGSTTFEAISTLSSKFATSLTATGIRLVECGPEPAILVCHGPNGRKWFIRPRNIPERWFPRKELDSDTFAYDLLNNGSRHAKRALMDADAWFDREEASHYELYEESYKISEMTILTLLVILDEGMLADN